MKLKNPTASLHSSELTIRGRAVARKQQQHRRGRKPAKKTTRPTYKMILAQ